MRAALAICAALALAGCDANTPVSVQKTDNSQVSVDLLFTVEGCRVYRFLDALHFHYLTICPGRVTSDYSCGKGCEVHDDVPTEVRP